MVVCKYFQQGSCRYGQHCRFEHVYGSKYSYHAAPNAPQQKTDWNSVGVTDEQLVNQVQSDVQAAIKGGQWILSSYAPFKEKPTLPGISDLSPEEARLFIYEAKANNTINEAVAYMNNIFKETRSKYEQLLQPSQSIMKVLRSLYKGEPVSSPFSNTAPNSAFGSNNTAASSIFRSAVQSTTPFAQNTTSNSIFGQSNNVFGPAESPKSVFAQANTGSASIFAQANTDAAKSIFGQANSAFSPPPSVFGQSPENAAAKSIFAQANANVFPSTQANPANIFANASQQYHQSDPFGQNQNTFATSPANVFGGASPNVFQQQSPDDNNVYSKMEELTEEDLEAYKLDQFKLGFVPEIPPPLTLCK